MSSSTSRLGFLERCLLKVAKRGNVPTHVAFIMDGNRRFARSKGRMEIEGHRDGFSSLLKILEWCVELERIKTVTVYAFSIDNFGRPKREVDSLMHLAEAKFEEFLENEALVMKHGIRVRILGNLALLPERVKRAAARVMLKTWNHDQLTLNICFSYSSGEEMIQTTHELVQGVREGTLLRQDIDAELFNHTLYTRGDSPQLLIRTSGECRLSDFLVWQLNRAHLSFINMPWPALDIWRFVSCFLSYNMSATGETGEPCSFNARQVRFLEKLQERDLSRCISLEEKVSKVKYIQYTPEENDEQKSC